MTIYEYGDRKNPHILLIHGMWMCHEMMRPYVEKMRSEYHIIAPDLTGHGSDMGSFEGAEQEAAAKMYSAADIDSDVMKKLSGSMGRT